MNQPLDKPYETTLDRVHWDGPDLIVGDYRLTNAKIESLHIEQTDGKQTVAQQWQGLSEGLQL